MVMSFRKFSRSKADPSKQEAHESNVLGQKTTPGYSIGNSKADSNKEQKSNDSTLTGQPLDPKIQRQHVLVSEEKEETSEYFSMIGEIGASSKINKQMTEVKMDDLGEIRQIFDVFDQDGNGVITANELRSILGSLGQSTTEAEVMDMVNSIGMSLKVMITMHLIQLAISLLLYKKGIPRKAGAIWPVPKCPCIGIQLS